jgi:DNA-binding MarR family transcriptional regulator
MVIFLDHLEREGWVTRGTHPTDRRAHFVSLTEPGIRRLRSLRPQLRRVEKEFLSELSAAQQQSLRSLLMAVVKRP